MSPDIGAKTAPGGISIYLALTFMLLVSFMGAVLESASLQNAKNSKRAALNNAIESVFAEYRKELLEDYDIFALEATYEDGSYDEGILWDRLRFYGANDFDHSIKRIQFLTDNGCTGFLDQVIAFMQHKYGLDYIGGIVQKTEAVELYEDQASAYEEEFSGVSHEVEAVSEVEANAAGNQTATDAQNKSGTEISSSDIEEVLSRPILSMVKPKDMEVSDKSAELSELPSHRELRKGSGGFSDFEDNLIAKGLTGEYLLEHFGNAAHPKENRGLSYEIEYILCGSSSDKVNLQKIANRLVWIRFVLNYMYIQSDKEKKNEAEIAAAAISVLLMNPEIYESLSEIILFAWAYGESCMDVKSLLQGNRVPAMKSKKTWQLGLKSLLKVGSSNAKSDSTDEEGGLSYEDYLRAFLLISKQQKKAIRALDMIELTLTREKGLDFFKVDHCIEKIEIESTAHLRKGINYSFPTYFGYN
ncbi:MAG: DUF5702 domain-containing protein [Lachnospiraceae bacterium]|jgi:hypothetical protein|nr:DUF5702 domain-containing protein [Lachnospiraceae bacterium]